MFNLFDDVATVLSLPIQMCWTIVTLPWRLLSSLMGSVAAGADGWVGQKVRREMKTAGVGDKRGAGGGGGEKRRAQGRAGKKLM